jgi:predicted dehydrogenase
MTPIRIALVGAGVFAREAHLPALRGLPQHFEIAAVYSRTYERAAALAALLETAPEVFTDLSDLLAREDIEAVDLVLPIEQLPAAVASSLAAGKHVISEKPVTPTVEDGKQLLSIYANHPNQVWSVAENWRYEPAYILARDLLSEIGTPLLCHWVLQTNLTADNKYYQTEWRRSGTFPGGFLLDGGVHQVAALRQIIGEISRVSAFTAQLRPDLPPSDTLVAALQFERGLIGSLTMSFAAASPFPTYLNVVGERGVLRVDRGYLEISVSGNTQSIPLEETKTVQEELADFAKAVSEGAPLLNTPQQALQDVAVIEAILRSGATGASVVVERVV